MKRLLMLAALFGGLTLAGFSSTAEAHGWRNGGGYGGGYGYHHGYGGGYGWRGGFRPNYGWGYRRYAAPGVFIGGPRFGVGVAPVYGYPPPIYGPGYGYGYGW